MSDHLDLDAIGAAAERLRIEAELHVREYGDDPTQPGLGADILLVAGAVPTLVAENARLQEIVDGFGRVADALGLCDDPDSAADLLERGLR